uniref:MER3 helicase-like winged helix domain-containing protein n=1 Tax=Cannabis sativa TaxID=3483 RepID=A0A803NKY8_CANSA
MLIKLDFHPRKLFQRSVIQLNRQCSKSQRVGILVLKFVSKLANQLNVEIVLGTIQNAKEGCSWLGYTYLYVRMIRNLTLNGLESDVLKMDVTLEERRAGLVLCSLRETPLDVIVVTSDNAMQYQRTSFLIPDNIKGLSPGSMFLAMSNGLMIPCALLTCNFMW